MPASLPPILFEDDCILAFDKPSGVGHLMEEIQARLGPGVANVHRLDADTTGVFLCAKTRASQDFLSGQFQSKTVDKVYHTLVILPPLDEASPKAAAPVRGPGGALPAEFTVELPLGPDEARPGRMRVFGKRGGRPCLTRFRVLESFGAFAWIECRPVSGRLHQIQVHLAAAGVPVLGDTLYGIPGRQLLLSDLKRRYKGRGEERPLVSRLALHASELGFIHPASRLPVVVRAPLPKDLLVALKYLGKFRDQPKGRA